MMILALESSATTCSAALCRDGELVAQSFQNSGLTHSATLMPMAADLLKNWRLFSRQQKLLVSAPCSTPAI